jgi:hypothetical protein
MPAAVKPCERTELCAHAGIMRLIPVPELRRNQLGRRHPRRPFKT